MPNGTDSYRHKEVVKMPGRRSDRRTILGVLRDMPGIGTAIEVDPGCPVWTPDEVFDGFLNKKIRVTIEVVGTAGQVEGEGREAGEVAS